MNAPDEPLGRQVLRHPSQVAVSLVLAVLVTALLSAMALEVVGDWPALAVAICLGIAVSVYELRSAVYVDERGIAARNLSRMTRWEWEEIAAIEHVDGVGNRPPEVTLVDVAGCRTRLLALTGTHVQTRSFRAWAARQAAWLDGEARRRAAARLPASRHG